MGCNPWTTECQICGGPRMERYYSTYCERHFRFTQMQSMSKTSGKGIPTMTELDALWEKCGGCCELCGEPMEVRGNGRRSSRKRRMSLQHDKSGAFRLLCISCNCAHAHWGGSEEDFYQNYMKSPQRALRLQRNA